MTLREARITVYRLMGITKPIPPVTPHDISLHAQFDALLKARK